MEKVLLASSGGIDSSVAAYILKQQGIIVEGVFFILFDEPTNIDLAKQTAEFLDMKLHIVDLRQEFKSDVITPFFEDYKKGLTPNPCVICNKKIKFPMLKLLAERFNLKYIATGHYARIARINNLSFLIRGIDKTKDQSYFLYGINRSLLSNIMFPLGDYTKEQIRQIADRVGIPSRIAKESTEVCFLKDKRYYEDIQSGKRGPIIQMSTGKIIGQHRGIHLYTIGQRKRLGISSQYPLYVIKIEPSENAIYVDSKDKVFMREFLVSQINWLYDVETTEFVCDVKIRYAMNPEKAVVRLINETDAKVTFEKPQFAPTPGQSAVFYWKDIVLGGGVIKEIVQDL